jgi:hypothetical protein
MGGHSKHPLARAVVLASMGAYLVGLGSNLFPFAADVHGVGPHALSALLLFGLLVGLDVRGLLRPTPVPIGTVTPLAPAA